jgi:hypothetical protein
MVSFDNGDVWRNYDPQADLLRIESSPSRFHLDVNFRKKLIAQNYVLTMEREALVAGRRTSVVFLKAKHPELADRRLYIDAANSLILRYVVDEPDGRSVVTVDTKSVDLESPVDVSEYEKLGDGAAKVEKAWGPIEVSRPSDAARYAGFTPVVPTEIPAGFAKQALHVVGTQKRPFVGVRLTDGMAVATVYLWKSVEGQEEPFKGACDAQGGNGTRVKVVGEVSDRLKGELARLFAREYGGQTSERGTVGSEGRVQDVRSTGGRAGVRRPKLVIDFEAIPALGGGGGGRSGRLCRAEPLRTGRAAVRLPTDAADVLGAPAADGAFFRPQGAGPVLRRAERVRERGGGARPCGRARPLRHGAVG